jgi:hypothetical protein
MVEKAFSRLPYGVIFGSNPLKTAFRLAADLLTTISSELL